MKFKLGNSFADKLQSRVAGIQFEVGILEDKPHKEAQGHGLFETPMLGTYAGGPVRKMTRISSDKTIGQVLIANMERLNINLLLKPFQEKNSDLLKFTNEFLKWVVQRGDVSVKRVENLLQAVVRNPILRQEYGTNSSSTADNKGFNRNLIDTAQVFKNIRARAKRV